MEGNETFKILFLWLWDQIYNEKNASKIIVIMLLKRKNITTYKYSLKNLQAKAIMQNNFKLTKKELALRSKFKIIIIIVIIITKY